MNSAEKAVAIVGFHDGATGQVASWFEDATGLKIACFVVDSDSFSEIDVDEENKKRVCKTTEFPKNKMFKGRPLIASSNWIEKLVSMGISKVLSLEPLNDRRQAQLELIKKNGLQLISAIHPSALILSGARIAEGVWINAGAIIGYKAEIGSGTIINTGAQIDHHNVIEECCQIDPGVVTAGNVVVRKCCYLHTGSKIINRIIIGSNSIIGAGAVVIKNVPPNSTAVGVPARIIKRNGNRVDV